jgi:outer membrane lipoprotein-sorting protein
MMLRIKEIRVFAIFLLFCCLILSLYYLPFSEAQENKKHEVTDVSGLLRRMGRQVSDFRSLKTDFVQEKDLAIFKNKIVLKGRIYLQKPGRIAWHVDTPVKFSVLITDTMIRQWDEDTDQVQEISLSKNPVFKVALGQLTTWFNGDYISLLNDYTVRIRRQNPVVLEFFPKETNAAKKFIKSITITFREDEKYLKQIKIQETSGDRTTLTFEGTVLNAPVEERFFKVDRRV